jgi:hypothetical protein
MASELVELLVLVVLLVVATGIWKVQRDHAHEFKGLTKLPRAGKRNHSAS